MSLYPVFMIRLFYGEDSFGISKEIDKIISSVGDTELTIFENGEPKEIFLNFLTQSFFTKKRLFIIKNTNNLLKEENNLIDTLEKIPSDTDIIFCLPSPKKEKQSKKQPLPILKTKFYKFLKENGEVKGFDVPTPVNIISFIKKRVQEEEAEIAPLAAERLASFTSGDLWQLDEEIKKLSLYKMGGKELEPIQTSDVDELVKANFEANIFNLLDAIADKNQRKAVQLLNEFLESGENEIYILSMITRGFRNIAMAKFEKGVTESTLAKKAGLHPFVAKKAIAQSRNFTETEIAEIYARLVWADFKLKSGAESRQILLRLIV